jgi:hypothetical protein
MNDIDFIRFKKWFKETVSHCNLSQIQSVRKFISCLIRADDEQYTEIIQILSSEEDKKKPSNKEEFDRITKDLRK